MAIVPFMVYQLAGFGTLHFVVSKLLNWVVNIAILILIVTSYVAYRQGMYFGERILTVLLILAMGVTAVFGIFKLKQMQMDYTRRYPPDDGK